ncbi:hypothetical protein M406DRAFT_328166 [Cryphonectria parasitica EP155]|uniref:BTB domain-containing protein n=1 Tax=Cryphonectria parasitica (strain ATCC 38755 / EP155) TaxID=660469 RepID=A0A9P5CQ15_CRYP1|nr:uncharacterized protein M406DRAFT_328166 [Cryphonectria parasitica EP155]KAF3767059.1 hypothetical protein M406DRAFT_328166 [Cryphonectria parasitica EP155]
MSTTTNNNKGGVVATNGEEGSRSPPVEVVPYTGPAGGVAYTQMTPPEMFCDFIAYILFCDQGPKLRILCANILEDGRVKNWTEYLLSRKLFSDFGAYFEAAMRGPFLESNDYTIHFDDLEVEDFVRLNLFVRTNGTAPRIQLGLREEQFYNLIRLFILADRFHMVKVLGWLRTALDEHFLDNATWMSVYDYEVLEQNIPGAEDRHRAMLHNYGAAYTLLHSTFPDHEAPMKDKILTFVNANCPGPLMTQLYRDIDVDFALELFRHMFQRRIRL